jgi:hypothetical protein
VPAPPALLRPFPAVRMKGTLARGGARITLLKVTAPRKARVRVRCAGKSCPLHSVRRKPGRIHKLERYLRAGTKITIRVTRAGFVGKHVQLVIRADAAPSRTDRCAAPGTPGPIACPA